MRTIGKWDWEWVGKMAIYGLFVGFAVWVIASWVNTASHTFGSEIATWNIFRIIWG